MLDLYLTLQSTQSLLNVWLRQAARRPTEEQQANVPKGNYLKPKFSYYKERLRAALPSLPTTWLISEDLAE